MMALAPSSSSHLKVSTRTCLGRLYIFEWVALASFAAMVVFAVTAPVVIRYALLAFLTFRKMAVIALLAVVAILVITAVRVVRHRSAWRTALSRSEVSTLRFWTDLLRITVAFSVVETAHLTLKVYVPVINSANHDQALRAVDQMLAFRHDPVALVTAAITNPTVLRLFDFIYSQLYFLLLWGGVVVFFAFLTGRRRTAFFSSFVVMWQLGLLLYILVPSWGPVFTTPGIFESTLQHCPATVAVQAGLHRETLAIVRGNYNIIINLFGIAAFPSLHVAVFVLYALWARAVGRVWFAWNVIFGVVIVIGSMLTGYHYLVDGIGGALVAVLAYHIATRRSAERTWPASDGDSLHMG